ncbi:MAG: C40 family peptidase [Vicinamibacterales bacterium]|jgi:cell wall-associated NlpC family hydrolase
MAHLRALRFRLRQGYGGQARLIVAGALAVVVTGCASSGGMVYTPRPFPVPGGGGTVAVPAPAEAAIPPGVVPPPTGRPAAPGSTAKGALPAGGTADGYALSSTALALRGAPYRNGGIDPNGFDCSGFVRYVYEQHGVPMPREVREQFRVGKSVDRSRLEAGDLVFFSTVAPGASHVGIMIGGDQFIHAPSERGVVRVENLSVQYWASRYVGAKRVN